MGGSVGVLGAVKKVVEAEARSNKRDKLLRRYDAINRELSNLHRINRQYKDFLKRAKRDFARAGNDFCDRADAKNRIVDAELTLDYAQERIEELREEKRKIDQRLEYMS